MRKIAILDRNARELAKGFKATADKRHLDLSFQAFTEIQHLHDQLRLSPPDLVLLHHTWEGLDTSEIIESIRERCNNLRVVVFTARDVNIGELIQCVRGGVADYWQLNKCGMDFMIERLSHFCDDSGSTLMQLGLASDATIKLLQEAGDLETELLGAKNRLTEQTERLREFESIERKEALREQIKVVQASVYFVVVSACFAALKAWAKVETWAALACIGMICVLLLFLNGKITEAIFRWVGGAVSLKGSNKKA